MQIDRQFALLFDRLLNAKNVRKNLAFVIGCAACKNVAVLQNRFERRRIPKPQRIGRLHIVMSVDQNGAVFGSILIARPNDGMTTRRNKFCFQTNAREFFHEPIRAFR